MKRYLQKKSGAFVMFVLASIVCEAITFLMLGFGLLPTYFLIPLAMTFIVACIVFIVPGYVLPVILYSMILLLQCVISITNIILYRIQGDIFTKDLLKLVGEARAAIEGGFAIDFSVAIPFAILFIVALAVQVFVLTRKESKEMVGRKRHGALVLACASVFIGMISFTAAAVQVGGLSCDGESNIFGVSVRENFDSFKFKVPFFRAFGTFSLIYKNVLLNTSPSVQIINARTMDETLEYFSEAENPSRFRYFYDDNCSDDCEDQYCYSPDIGNNVIVILLESFEDFMISKDYTPALYNLQQKSIVFDNFYGHNKTDVSEASAIFGSYPMFTNIVPTWADVNGRHSGDTRNPNLTQEFSFSMPNVLSKQGYGECNYFHNSSGSHYSRSFTHKTYGFDGAYFVEDFEIGPEYDDTVKWRNDWQWFVPEKDFFEESVDLILPQSQSEPFFSFITTINAHGTYASRDNLPEIYYEKLDAINDKDFADLKARMSAAQYSQFKVALSKAMVADDGIAYLLEQIAERGLADNTTIMAFADHNAYGNNLSYNVKQFGKQASPAHKIPAFLYSPSLAKYQFDEGPFIVDKFMTHFDLVPTLFDLLGLEVNSRMYLGFHAFDERENIAVSKLGVIFNDKFMTDGMNILWSCPDATSQDLTAFRERYLDLVNRWGFVNNLYSPLFSFQSDTEGDSLLQ